MAQWGSSGGPARACVALVGNAAWWTDDVLACVGASGLLAVVPRHGDSTVAERFAAGARVASAGSTAAGDDARLFVVEPVLRDPTPAQRSAATSSPEQDPGWGSSLARMLSIGAAGDLADAATPTGKQLAGWRLSVVESRRPEAMLDVLLRRCSWAAAHELCTAYSLPAEAVHRAQWLAEPVTMQSVQAHLSQAADRRWALEQLLQRTSADETTQRTLLRTALEEIDRHCSLYAPAMGDDAQSEAPGGGAPSAWTADNGDGFWWLCKRLQVLQRLDRLDTLCAVFDGYDLGPSPWDCCHE